MNYSFKQKVGCLVYDLPRFLWSMRPSSDHSWVYMRNRNERLLSIPGRRSPSGARCDWQWTSDLHIAKVFPSLGRALMKRALRDWPIEFKAEPIRHGENVELSFIIGHRGLDRLPQLLLTLQSIAAQREVTFECLVVEQSAAPEAKDHLPSWVRYVHTPLPYEDMPYSRAWAFNVGAGLAIGDVLVLHDNDLLVPADYGRELITRFSEGSEVMNLKRFIFYLNEADCKMCFSGAKGMMRSTPPSIMQNALGGSLAVARKAYADLGGFDESFIGWGGEDNEFWERAQTRRLWNYGYLPMVHLWHQMQSEKYSEGRSTAKLYEERSAIPPEERIAELAARDFGNPRREVGTQTSDVRSHKAEVLVSDL